MSIETLVQQADLSSTAFNKENFDEVVMSTYGRFPIALGKGLPFNNAGNATMNNQLPL